MLFRASFAAADFPGYLLRLAFLVNLFVVYCQSRDLAPVISRMKTGPKTSALLTAALLLLGGCLIAGMVFTTSLKNYLSVSGL
jgi:hypothetical protein